jgi:hypothetical protein
VGVCTPQTFVGQKIFVKGGGRGGVVGRHAVTRSKTTNLNNELFILKLLAACLSAFLQIERE